MTDFSRAAKSILIAAIDADGEESMHVPYESIASAALRAAADEVYSLLNVPASTTEPEMVTGMRTAYTQYHRFLHKIAQELEETK